MSNYFRFRVIFERVSCVEKTELNFTEVDETLMHKKYEIVELCKDLQKQPFICGDYKELHNLVKNILFIISVNDHCTTIWCDVRRHLKSLLKKDIFLMNSHKFA